MNLVSIPAGRAFLDTLADGWLHAVGTQGGGLLLLPTRRAARELAHAFLRRAGGRPLLLPRITAIGGVDEAPLALAGALDLPPAVTEPVRLGALSRLILALPEAAGGVRGADRAWPLARSLAQLMDEAERAEISLRDTLPNAVDAVHAAHWDLVLRFLAIVTRAWPDWLAERDVLNPAARAVALLRAQASWWSSHEPAEPVWAAGISSAMPATAALLRMIASLPNGRVVLPGLDTDLDGASWEALADGHPQAGLRALLASMGARREDVAPWPEPLWPEPPWPEPPGAARIATAPAGRARLLSRALLPAASLGAWRTADPAADITGLFRLSPADEQEEAVAIALVLRDALEVPGRRAALVTPDRALAGRVATELLRWGVIADDSAGEELAETPPAVFLRVLARVIAEAFAPVPLLSLLKHPMAGAGLSVAACRTAARALERAALRGPRPLPGLTGLRLRIDAAAAGGKAAPPSVPDLLDRLETCLAPLLRVAASVTAAPVDALAALVEAAEALATTDTEPGPARLWALEEGEALAAHLAECRDGLALLPDQPIGTLPGLLDEVLRGQVVRSRRALRGRNGQEHPRVAIWGLLEARLQAVDLVVLGGLAEGVWPPATDPGPWLSRPMRARVGLPSPEERIGEAAHDFVSAACSAPVAILSCSRRRDRAPAVPARWLARLDACAKLPAHPATDWARRLDQPAGAPRPVPPPRPCPPVALRPRRLGVTEIETWIANPYAIYARHILRVRPLDPIEQPTDAADYGSLVHRGLELFLTENGTAWPPDAADRLRVAFERALVESRPRPALAEWWLPRLARIAAWVFGVETARRSEMTLAAVRSEASGECALAVPGGFVLRGRADRIERRADGMLAILDYKTGYTPSNKAVEQGFAPQLPLEAAMAARGAFGPELAAECAELAYWHLTGGWEAGHVVHLLGGDAGLIAGAAADAWQRLHALVTAFDDADRAYLSQPHPGRRAFADYDRLARVLEWGTGMAEPPGP